jgi:hypothetical protein
MDNLEVIEIVRAGLAAIALPPTKRPAIGPQQTPTKELVNWGATVYAFSLISHIRQNLAGLKTLLDTENEITACLVYRHLYEWTMHSAYMEQQLGAFAQQQNWVEAWELFLQVATGNAWIKNHGASSLPKAIVAEIPKQLRINKLVKAYETHQQNLGIDVDVQDIYGLLSEHSHPNGACLLPYEEYIGDSIFFEKITVPPFPHPITYLMDLLLCVKKILVEAEQYTISAQLSAILKEVANYHPKN